MPVQVEIEEAPDQVSLKITVQKLGKLTPTPQTTSWANLARLNIPKTKQLFVGNLPKDCTEDHLTELFAKYGKVTILHRRCGYIPVYFAFLEFESTDCVERALADKQIMSFGNNRLYVEAKEAKK